MNHRSNNGKNIVVVVADRATGLLFAYSMPSKAAIIGVARMLLDLSLTFVVPVAIRSDLGGGVHSARSKTRRYRDE